MIERQESSPTVEVLERIAKALGIEPARLFDERAGWKGRSVMSVPTAIYPAYTCSGYA
jgi:transcriptional regulator with XRE-family HTH domain